MTHAWKWEKRWYSGEVRVFVRYVDEDSEWEVRASYKTDVTVQLARVPDTEWWQLTSQPVNSGAAFMYAATQGMNEIVKINKTIKDNCSFTNAGNVHIGKFKNAWSQYDRDNQGRR